MPPKFSPKHLNFSIKSDFFGVQTLHHLEWPDYNNDAHTLSVYAILDTVISVSHTSPKHPYKISIISFFSQTREVKLGWSYN